MQPDPCQQRQKVRNDVSLHRLCRYGGQNEEQTERRVGGGGAELETDMRIDNYRQKGRTEMGAIARKTSKWRHERGNM